MLTESKKQELNFKSDEELLETITENFSEEEREYAEFLVKKRTLQYQKDLDKKLSRITAIAAVAAVLAAVFSLISIL